MDYSYQHILTEDKQRANKIVLIWTNILAGLVFFIWALGLLGVLSATTWIFYYLVPIAAIVLIIPKLMDLFFHFTTAKEDKEKKNTILAWANIFSSLVAVFLLSCSLSHFVYLAWIFPLFVACQYSSKKMALVSYFAGLILLIASYFIAMYVGAWDYNFMAPPVLNVYRHLNLTILGNSMYYLFPIAALYILAFPLVYAISKRGEVLLKKQRLVIMAHQTRKSLDELSEFPDTFETDCKIKARYLAKNGIDVDRALGEMDQSIEKYNEFVLTFVGESRRKEDELMGLLSRETLLQYGAKVHALRVKAHALGLNQLTDTAFFHEMEAYAGNYEIVLLNWDKLSKEIKEATDLFTDYIKSLGLRNHAYDETGNQISFAEWGEQLHLAFDALDAYDTIRARDILNHLLQYQIDKDITQKLTSIVANIDDILKA